MASFDKAISHLLAWEGGFVNHKSDPGGATNKGITFKTFKSCAKTLLGVEPTLDNLKALTEDQAKTIYKSLYWNRLLADAIISQSVASILFDGYVNMGANAVKLIQGAINENKNGIVGKQTIYGINKHDPKELFNNYKQARIKYYEDLVAAKPKLKVFEKGWKNRINSFLYEA